MSLFLYMKIKSSLDLNLVSDDLQKQLSSVDYNPDLHKIYHNINGMIEKLSKLEVEARRTKKDSYLIQQLTDINKSIDHLEKLLLMAKLMK